MNDANDSTEAAGTQSTAPPLPLQNVLLAGFAIAVVAGAAQWLNAQTGIPFGHRQVTATIATPWPRSSPVWLTFACVVALLSARGVAKLLLLPWRTTRCYGYWLLGVNALLGTVPLASLDLFATRVAHWWHWQSDAWQWQGIALPNLVGWLLVNVLALLLATPALIDKRPVQPPPGLRLLTVWFGLSVVCIAACVARTSNAAVAVLVAPTLLGTMLAFQNSRRSVSRCSDPPPPR